MKRIAILALLAAAAAAQPDSSRDLRFAFWVGSDYAVNKAFDKEHDVQAVAARPDKTLEVCRYAVDTAHRIGLVHHYPEKGQELAARVQDLAKRCADQAPGDLDASWAVIEARIYEIKLMEFLAASALRLAFPAKPLVADHGARWQNYVEEIKNLARAGEGDDRAAEGVLRALEFQLEAGHYLGADEAQSQKLLTELRAMLPDDADDDAKAAANAAVLLGRVDVELAAAEPDLEAAAKTIREGLALVAPLLDTADHDSPLIRRHNDLVTLAKLHPDTKVESKYRMVPCPLTEKGLTVSLPMSRAWRVLQWTSHVTGERQCRVFRLTPSADELTRLRFDTYEHGWKYPLLGKGKKADGKKPNKVAALLYEKDKDYRFYKIAKKKKRKRPKRKRLNESVKSAYYYEVLSIGPKQRSWFHRLRAWVFPGKERSYGIRLDDSINDGVEAHHPELVAMLDSVRGS
jgi:hypothetical protein